MLKTELVMHGTFDNVEVQMKIDVSEAVVQNSTAFPQLYLAKILP